MKIGGDSTYLTPYDVEASGSVEFRNMKTFYILNGFLGVVLLSLSLASKNISFL